MPEDRDVKPLLQGRSLVKGFPVGGKRLFGGQRDRLQAVAGVDIEVQAGETLGLVGESGCGKSTLAKLLGLLQNPDAGAVEFDGDDATRLRGGGLRDFRRRVQMVFQDPYSSLNPRLPIGAILEEPLIIHGSGNRAARRARITALMQLVGLDASQLNHYPHQFSGGQRQRIAIGRALALEPDLIIADEPLSALDVSVQSQILNLLSSLRERLGLAYLFISHDLAVVYQLADRVAVMYLGRVVETAPRESLFNRPAHPYTRALIEAVPKVSTAGKRRTGVATGDVPSPVDPPPGCPYHPRCPSAQAICEQTKPALGPAPERDRDHHVACHFPEQKSA